MKAYVLPNRCCSSAAFRRRTTFGFRQSDRKWEVDALLGSMRSIHFDVQGFNRTYWNIFVAAGFSVGRFYLCGGMAFSEAGFHASNFDSKVRGFKLHPNRAARPGPAWEYRGNTAEPKKRGTILKNLTICG